MTRSNRLRSVVSSKRAPVEMPALLIRTSMPPSSATVRSMRHRHCSAIATSVGTSSTLAPRLRQLAAASARTFGSRAAIARAAPARASFCAKARPIPDEAPVITTTLSRKSMSSAHPVEGQRLEQERRQRTGWIASAQIHIEPETLDHRQPMRLDQLDQCPVGILEIGEATGRIAYVVRRCAVDGEREAGGGAAGLPAVHVPDVKAEVNEAEIAPQAIRKDRAASPRLAHHQLDLSRSEQRAEGSLPRRRVTEQHAPERPVAAGKRGQIVENAALVIEDPVEAEQIAIDGKRALDVGHADQAAAQPARDRRRRRAEAGPATGGLGPVALAEPVAARNHLQEVAPWVAHPEMRGARGIAPHRAHPDVGTVGEPLARQCHVLGLDPGAENADVPELKVESGRLRDSAGELPDLAAGAA